MIGDNFLLTGSALSLAWALFGFVLVWALLRALDVVGGVNFGKWLRETSDENRARYYANRILAVCILVGLIVRPPI